MKEMDFIDYFIEEYKNNPCLWKANSADFKNRSKRQEAYQKLIEVAASHGEHYNIERTKQKINNLRCAFRHQLKKYSELKNNEKDEPYCPKRRYFESLMFLRDEENIERKPKQQSTAAADYAKSANELDIASDESSLCRSGGGMKEHITIERVEISEMEKMLGPSIKSSPEEMPAYVETLGASMPNIGDTLELGQTVVVNKDQLDAPEIYYFESTKDADRETTINTTVHSGKKSNHKSRKRSTSMSSQQSNDTAMSPPAAKSLKMDFTAMDFEKLFSLACKSIQQQTQDEHDDHYTHLGKIIAHKLRSMDQIQAIYAEKIISDVLFQGQLKQLTPQLLQQISLANFKNSASDALTANNSTNSQQTSSK